MKRILFLVMAAGVVMLTAGVSGAAHAQFGAAHAQRGTVTHTKGEFISVTVAGGKEWRMYAAGPEDAKSGVLFVHDYFGITEATQRDVERLGDLGYRAIAVDLYEGWTATTHEQAVKLMQAKDSNETRRLLRYAIDYLKRPGRKLASVGFSAGGIDAMRANLMAADLFSATVIVYGFGYDKLESAQLDKLKSPLLAVAGALDKGAVQDAVHFLADQRGKLFELCVYPGVDHGYAQPLFNEEKNYNAEATRVTWRVIEDFLERNMR